MPNRVINGEKFSSSGRTIKHVTLTMSNTTDDKVFIWIDPVFGEQGHQQRFVFDADDFATMVKELMGL